MDEREHVSLEETLKRTEADAAAALRAANAATGALKRYYSMARVGNLRDLRAALESVDLTIAELRQQVANVREGWDFDEAGYFADGSYTRELLAEAEHQGVQLFEQDDRLYCYPMLLRVNPGEQSLLIDKARERRVRPSVVIAHLRDLQRRPARFRSDAFLQSVYEAYSTLAARSERLPLDGVVIRLLDVYALFTLLPGQSREYSRQEFARDIYLLDRSGVTTTRSGASIQFPASSGTRSGGSTLRVITEHGREKVYYGIAFSVASQG